MKIAITILLVAMCCLAKRAISILQSYLALRRWRRQMLRAQRDRSRG